MNVNVQDLAEWLIFREPDLVDMDDESDKLFDKQQLMGVLDEYFNPRRGNYNPQQRELF